MNEPGFVREAREYLAMLHKRRAIVTTSLGLSLLTAVLYNYTARPVYQGTAQILIDKAVPKVLPTKDLVDPGVQDFQTEYEILRGRTLAERVVEHLALQKSPELQTGPWMNPWERFQRAVLGRTPPTVDTDGMPISPAAAALRSRLRIEPRPGGRLVNIGFLAYDPKLAATVANAVAELYIEQTLDFRFMSSSEATGWLSERLREQKRKVEEAERALVEYRARHGLEGFDEKGGGPGDRIAGMEAAILTARTERISKEALVGQLRGLTAWQLASAPALMGNPAVQQARSRVAELSAEQTRLSESLGERHPDMVRARSALAQAQEKLQSEARSAMRALEIEAQAARAKEASLAAGLEQAKRERLDTSRTAVEHSGLQREVESNRELYQTLLARAKETGLETELKASSVRIMEKAEVPRAPVSPNRMRNYQIALLIGLALGVGLGLLFEHIDNTVKTPEDVKEHLGVPFLGMVPNAGNVAKGAPPSSAGLALRNPGGAVAEAYRVLRTNLIFSSADASGRALIVSSANPGEGKTTTSANLGVALALNGAKVLLVDGDLRRPTLNQHFGLPKTPGLSDLIVGRSQASSAIHSTRYKSLQLMACGYAAPNPAELLGSASMKQILEALRAHYDWVLIDTPPILAMADTPVLCPLVDGVVMVVAAEESTRPAIQRALDQVRSVGGKVTGVVLNRVDLKRNSYYYGQYYGEYYRSYYADGPPQSRRQGGAAGAGSRRS